MSFKKHPAQVFRQVLTINPKFSLAMQKIGIQSNPRRHPTDFHISQEAHICFGTLFIWQDVAQLTHKTPHSNALNLILVHVTDGRELKAAKWATCYKGRFVFDSFLLLFVLVP